MEITPKDRFPMVNRFGMDFVIIFATSTFTIPY
jgi:hypothetical protein